MNAPSDPVAIVPLAGRRALVPQLAAAFRAEWPDYYGDRTARDVEADFHAEAQVGALPTRLVAVAGAALVGTIVLRGTPLTSLPHLRPGLGGLYVFPEWRGRGTGTALVAAGMDAARALGFGDVYATTGVAGGILNRLGWRWLLDVDHEGAVLSVYRAHLAG